MRQTSYAIAALFAACQCADRVNAQGVRFQKFNFTEPRAYGSPTISFPLTKDSANDLRKNSNSVSVVLFEEECDDQVNVKQFLKELQHAGVYPPSQPENREFWGEFEEVARVQVHRKNKEQNPCMTDPLPLVMPAMTQLWRGLSIVDVAEAVHDEFPGIYHNQMVANWVADTENPLKPDNKVIPKTAKIDFLRGPVLLSDMIGYAVRAVGPCDFALKWSVGRPRPEEVAWRVSRSSIDIPRTKEVNTKELIETIAEMHLKDATDFTAYAEGSPTHPSYPAMHSAASAGSFWLDVVMDLTKDQLCEARMLDWSVSYARTVAGVHYSSDNIAGLMVGQAILSQTLPTYLHDVYGSDVSIVESAIEKAKYDWTTFEESDCYKQQRFRTVPAPKPVFCFDKREIPVNIHYGRDRVDDVEIKRIELENKRIELEYEKIELEYKRTELEHTKIELAHTQIGKPASKKGSKKSPSVADGRGQAQQSEEL